MVFNFGTRSRHTCETSAQILCILHGFQLGIRSRHTDKRPNTVHFAWFFNFLIRSTHTQAHTSIWY